MRIITSLLLIVIWVACGPIQEQTKTKKITTTSLVVLGNVQDAGSPHIACKKACCAALFKKPDPTRKVVSLGLIIPESKETYLFEATPDMPMQMKMLDEIAPFEHQETPDGIFLTHAHIGHYAGLMYLGKEAMDADSVPVHVAPRMKDYLTNNGPWSQLVANNNLTLKKESKSSNPLPQFKKDAKYALDFTVMGQIVPHRDEYSETLGYFISGSNKVALFIPDIDKWEKWNENILELIPKFDFLFLDGTFYDGNELPGRDIKQIPHPFVIESMKLFKNLSKKDKAKIHFIHFNHTNPLLNKNSKEYKEVIKQGFNIANYGDVFEL